MKLDFEPNFQQKPWKHDRRSNNFKDSTLFGAPAILLTTLDRERGPVLNQRGTTRCTGYGTAANGWYLHRELMNPDWAAAKIGQKQGRTVDNYGGDPNATMKHQRDDGFLPQAVNSQTLENSTVEETGWNTWDTMLDFEAQKYDNISGYTKVTAGNGMDYFEAICAALQRNYDAKTGRGAGVDAFSGWYSDWYGETIKTAGSLAGFHRYLFVDFVNISGVPYLVAQNSYGEGMGNKGFHLFTREIVNWEYSQSGRSLKTLAALTPEMLEEAKKNTFLGAIIRRFIEIFTSFSNSYGR